MKSLYEILYGAKVAKQGVVEEFVGDSLDERWHVSLTGSGTAVMNDAINGGVKLTTGTSGIGDETSLNFNSIRPFSNTSSVIKCIFQEIDASQFLNGFGLVNTTTADYILYNNDTRQTFIQQFTNNNTTPTLVNTSVAVTTAVVNGTLILGSSFGKGYLQGNFETVSTTKLPTVKLQPYLRETALTTTAKSGLFRYCEVFNY